ncbi:MAG: PASTA domain-containing protein [Ignavibacteria bacterium]|nr:PASTA domain-containing protein [Ignavibacteria bacterium]
MTKKKRTLKLNLRRAAIVGVIGIAGLLLLDWVVMPIYVQQGKTTRVPHVVGLTEEEAMRLLADHGLQGHRGDVRVDKYYPVGSVAFQNPPADAEVKFGRGVYLTISSGENQVIMPALRGRSLRDASLVVERLGFRLGEVRYAVSTEFPENTIIEQSVPESTRVKPGSSISFIVSQGPSTDRIPVPFVVKRPLAEAQRMILNAGLNVGQITYQASLELLPNTVIDQYPRFGSFVASGDSIALFVAQKTDTSAVREY